MDLKCILAFHQDQEIIETNNPGKQEGVFFLGFFFKSRDHTRHCHLAVWSADILMVPGGQPLMSENCIVHLDNSEEYDPLEE